MQIGIIGLPTAGKTTVFNALTRGNVQPASYSTGKFDVHTGVVDVPDDRLQVLSRMFSPRKLTHAKVQYNDVAGLAKSAGDRGGFDAAMLNVLSQSDALIIVVRVFADASVPHPDGSVDPARDLAAVQTELLLADLIAVEKRQQRLKEDAGKRGGSQQEKDARVREVDLFDRLKARLDAEQPLRGMELSEEELRFLRGFGLLTVKPSMVIYNLGEDQSEANSPHPDTATTASGAASGPGALDVVHTSLRGKLEMELAQMSPEDAGDFLREYGITEPGLNRIVRLSYYLLGLQSFLTAGEDEVRAWTIRAGASAVDAAGTIHTDLARGFIRAEVVAYDDLIAAGSLAETRKRGTLRLEGKTYVVKDGDILNIKFNV